MLGTFQNLHTSQTIQVVLSSDECLVHFKIYILPKPQNKRSRKYSLLKTVVLSTIKILFGLSMKNLSPNRTIII